MRRVLLSLTAALVLVTVLFSAVAIGQSNAPLSLLQPLLLEVAQSVPLTFTLSVPTSPTNTVTVTVPAVVDLNIAIRLTSGLTPVVDIAPASQTLVSVNDLVAKGPPLIDNNSIPYEVEIPDGIEVVQWVTEADYFKNWGALGELRNKDEQKTLSSALFYVSTYDSEGSLLSVELGAMKLNSVKPGGTSPFSVMSSLPFEDVARYLIQVETSYER